MSSMRPESADLDQEVTPATQDELRRFLAENDAGPKRALTAVGGRTALDFGYPLSKPATTVSTTSLNRVVDYPARDMTITVEAGIRIDGLTELLKPQGQRIPIDVAQSNRATLGGALASNTSGPRRFGYGTFRDYLIGITAATADGRLFHSGGRVVKNVAGYDLCKLLVGSLGTLAIITQATLKLRPLPESSALVWVDFESPAHRDDVLDDLAKSQTRPAAVDTANSLAAAAIESEVRAGLSVPAALLVVGFEGSIRETEWQVAEFQKEIGQRRPTNIQVVRGAAADRLWTALTEFSTCSDEPLAFQASLLPSRLAQFEERASRLGISLLCRAGNGIAIGKLPDEVCTAAKAVEVIEPLASLARQAAGHLMILHCDPAWKADLSAALGPRPADELQRKLKRAFDPHELLNPGRLFLSSNLL